MGIMVGPLVILDILLSTLGRKEMLPIKKTKQLRIKFLEVKTKKKFMAVCSSVKHQKDQIVGPLRIEKKF